MLIEWIEKYTKDGGGYVAVLEAQLAAPSHSVEHLKKSPRGPLKRFYNIDVTTTTLKSTILTAYSNETDSESYKQGVSGKVLGCVARNKDIRDLLTTQPPVDSPESQGAIQREVLR
jgi:hypothetical protein